MPHIKANKINLTVTLNDPKCYEKLKENVDDFEKIDGFKIEVRNEKFNTLFHECYNSMKESANFIFFDQNGIKEITQDIFRKVIQLKPTDFLFFISSSFFKRFSETHEFKNYFSFSVEEIKNLDYYHIHRKVLQHYKSLIPSQQTYFLAPFSIKKGKNIYGLIFGTNHTLGIEKFLSVAWKIDKQRGEANYDIDGEKIASNSPFLFETLNVPSKRQIFETSVENKIANSELLTHLDAYYFALDEGFQLKDMNEIFKKLQKEGKINSSFRIISSKLHKEQDGVILKIA